MSQFVAHDEVEFFVGHGVDHRGAKGDVGSLDATGKGVGEWVIGDVKFHLGHIHDLAGLAHDVIEGGILVGSASYGAAHVVAVQPSVDSDLIEFGNELGDKRELLQLVQGPFVRIADKCVGANAGEMDSFTHMCLRIRGVGEWVAGVGFLGGRVGEVSGFCSLNSRVFRFRQVFDDFAIPALDLQLRQQFAGFLLT